MKSKLLLLIGLLMVTAKAFATTYTIHVMNYNFSPATLTGLQIGDVVQWTWDNGDHTTTSTSVPAGAAAWDQPIDQTHPTYSYTALVAGDYSYKCTPHAPGMSATFKVAAPTGINNVDGKSWLFLYPNPAINMVHLNLSAISGTTEISIVDVAGREALHTKADGGGKTDLSVASLANGAYILHAAGKGLTITEHFTIAH